MIYILTAVVVLAVFFIVKQTMSKTDKDVSVINKNDKNPLFLEDFNFSKGNYMLYVRHQELGEFAVTDVKSLTENRKALKVKLSLANFFPGEGDRGYGVMLFKDNKLIKSKTGALFNVFEIGSLKNHALPVTKHRYEGIKSDVQAKIVTLSQDQNAYIKYQPEFSESDKEYKFRIYFPSIAVPVTREKDSTGYTRIKTINGFDYNRWEIGDDEGFNTNWKNRIEQCIADKAGTTDFEISITNGTLSDTYLFDTNQDFGELQTADKRLLYLSDFMFYHYEAYISANQENAEKLWAIDYSDCISDEARNRPKVVAKMKALVKQSTTPNLSVDKGEVGLSGYQDKVKKSKKIYEQEYQLSWLEVGK